MNKVKKAIIPAAGLGTRFLPATIAQPKEMLIVVDKPVIQYVVEEAVKSGIREILIVTGRGKRAVEDHFDPPEELEQLLEDKGKKELLKAVREVSELANIQFIRQRRQRGLADAIYQGKNFAGKEPFAVLLGDTIIDSNGNKPCLFDMMEIFTETSTCVVATEYINELKNVERYGIVDFGQQEPLKTKKRGISYYKVNDLVEKPKPEAAPSRLAIASRYIFTPKIFKHIEATKPGKGGEIQITDSMRLAAKNDGVLAYQINGKRYDVGNKIDFIKTNIDFALKRRDIRDDMISFLKELEY